MTLLEMLHFLVLIIINHLMVTIARIIFSVDSLEKSLVLTLLRQTQKFA